MIQCFKLETFIEKGKNEENTLCFYLKRMYML